MFGEGFSSQGYRSRHDENQPESQSVAEECKLVLPFIFLGGRGGNLAKVEGK